MAVGEAVRRPRASARRQGLLRPGVLPAAHDGGGGRRGRRPAGGAAEEVRNELITSVLP